MLIALLGREGHSLQEIEIAAKAFCSLSLLSAVQLTCRAPPFLPFSLVSLSHADGLFRLELTSKEVVVEGAVRVADLWVSE